MRKKILLAHRIVAFVRSYVFEEVFKPLTDIRTYAFGCLFRLLLAFRGALFRKLSSVHGV